jgi:hypothetical protein
MHVTIIGLIYRSVQYLEWMMHGIRSYGLTSSQHQVEYLIVANEPTISVAKKLQDDKLVHITYHDPRPSDYYLNKVYRAHNFGAQNAKGEVIVFVNSDLGYTSGWLDNLLRELNKGTIPVSRLVESAKMLSGKYGVSKNFGRHPNEFRESEFQQFAGSIKEQCTKPGGLYGPVAFYREDFLRAGCYPEGNIYQGGAGRVDTPFVRPADEHFFYHNPIMKEKQHITVFDSIIYHVIEGEKDE